MLGLLGGVLDPAGDMLEKGLSPVGNTLDSATKPVTGTVGKATKPVGDALNMGKPGKESDDSEASKSIGGKTQSADNPLGL